MALAAAAILPMLRLHQRPRTAARRHVQTDGAPPLVVTHAQPKRLAAENAAGQPVLGYASVPPTTFGRQKKEIHAQLEAIASACRQRRLVLIDVVREREPDRGKALQRPALGYALQRIADGEAQGLVVADLSRVTRSVTDLGDVLEWFMRARARLVSVIPVLDTGEQSGRLAARALIEVSSWERERLSERTRKGLEAARREGRRRGRSGVADNPELCERIVRMRAEGMTLQAIADRLNEEGVPTIRGGVKWRPSSVQAAAGYRRPRARSIGRRGPT
jgi:DNA invertase Pin-like site-specific DNA recombinase